MAILNYDNIYTQKGAPNTKVNPKIVGAVWFDYETGITYTCKDNTMNKNVWVKCCRSKEDLKKDLMNFIKEDDEIAQVIKDKTKKPSINSQYGEFGSDITAIPEYKFDLNVENDFDWVCPPDVYPMFRYGKYLIVPLLSGYGVSYNRTGFLNDGRLATDGANMYYHPTVTITGSKITITTANVELCRDVVGNTYLGRVHPVYVYPTNYVFLNHMSLLPAIGSTTDILSRIIINHKHFSTWYNGRMVQRINAKITDQKALANDLRLGIDFSSLNIAGYSSEPTASFISITPRLDSMSKIHQLSAAPTYVYKDGGQIYTLVMAEYYGDARHGPCDYWAIRLFT